MSSGSALMLQMVKDSRLPTAANAPNPEPEDTAYPSPFYADGELELVVQENPPYVGLARNKPDNFDVEFAARAEANAAAKLTSLQTSAMAAAHDEAALKKHERSNSAKRDVILHNANLFTFVHNSCSQTFNNDLSVNCKETFEAFSESNAVKYWYYVKELARSNKLDSSRKSLVNNFESLITALDKPDKFSTTEWADIYMRTPLSLYI